MCLGPVNNLDLTFYLKLILKITSHNDLEREINFKKGGNK